MNVDGRPEVLTAAFQRAISMPHFAVQSEPVAPQGVLDQGDVHVMALRWREGGRLAGKELAYRKAAPVDRIVVAMRVEKCLDRKAAIPVLDQQLLSVVEKLLLTYGARHASVLVPRDRSVVASRCPAHG